MDQLVENFKRFLQEQKEPEYEDIAKSNKVYSVSLGVIPPNMHAMSVGEALVRLGFMEPEEYRIGDYHAHYEVIRHLGKEAAEKDWVYITNLENFYVFSHPNEFGKKEWSNAVSEIAKLRKAAGEPQQALNFELRGRRDRYFAINAAATNRIFVTALVNKKEPRRSIMHDPNLLEEAGESNEVARFEDPYELSYDQNKRYVLSPLPLDSVTFVQQKEEGRQAGKPRGLWYSCGREWIDWLKYTMPQWAANIQYVYEIELSDQNLVLTNKKEILDFQKKYGGPSKFFGTIINWKMFQSEGYSGIEICPYDKELSFEIGLYSMWYSAWDVSSGCIWDPAGLTSIKLVAERSE